MNIFDIREPWQEGTFFMTGDEIQNCSTKDTIGKVIDDLYNSCVLADKAINKAMGK